jgi:hypothetical protein
VSKRARKEVWEATRQGREVRQPLKERIPEEEQQPRPPKFPRASMQAMGWLCLDRGRRGWRRTGLHGVEMILYENYKAESSLAECWGFDLARKGIPRSFAQTVAADISGFAGEVFLRGFDNFHRPAKIERGLLDYEREDQ